MSEVAAKVAAPKRVVLHAMRFKQAEFVRHIYHVIPEQGVTLEDVLQVSYWSQIAGQLEVGDHVEVYPEDQTYWAHLLVIDCNRLEARMQILNYVEIGANAASPLSEETLVYFVKWRGPQFKWAICRKADGSSVKDGFASRDKASAGLSDYLKALAK
jgi:hypothetical protein